MCHGADAPEHFGFFGVRVYCVRLEIRPRLPFSISMSDIQRSWPVLRDSSLLASWIHPERLLMEGWLPARGFVSKEDFQKWQDKAHNINSIG
jgi:hypothetical protein